LSECGYALVGGSDRAISGEYMEVVELEAVDGRCTRYSDSIHRLVNLKPWEYEEVGLPLKLLWRTGWWRSIGREVS
jgi:hypothetical protein